MNDCEDDEGAMADMADAAKDARIAALEAEVAPFLNGQPDPGPNYSDQSHMMLSVTLGDIRTARAALGAGQ